MLNIATCVIRMEQLTSHVGPTITNGMKQSVNSYRHQRRKHTRRSLSSIYVQYILSSQLKAVHEYAQAHKVILKGDIPIGVNRYGCDVWTQPRYFNLNGQAGAPPDDFSVNWAELGLSNRYNWEEMDKRWLQVVDTSFPEYVEVF